jgi:hypothetical protein
VGNPLTLANGAEAIVTHASSPNNNVAVAVYEQINHAGLQVSPSNMTAAAAPTPYVASDSVHYDASTPAWCMFDGDIGTIWNTYGSGLPQWAKIDLGVGAAISSYDINSPGGDVCPSTWVLEGSNDNSGWTTVDTQTLIPKWSGVRTFTLGSPSASFRYWRLTVSYTAAGWINIRELALYGAPSISLELCTTGQYSSSQQFGVKLTSATETRVVNLSGVSKTVFIAVLAGG